MAAEITIDSPDFGHLEPMVDAVERELGAVGVAALPETVLADPGYWHKQQMENVVSRGMQVLIPPDSGLRTDSRPGWDKGLYAFMRLVLSTELGHALYRKRMGTIEPVFGQMKFNRGFDRFQRRGRSAVRSEWRLAAAAHNLLKLHNHPDRRHRALKRVPRRPAPREHGPGHGPPRPTAFNRLSDGHEECNRRAAGLGSQNRAVRLAKIEQAPAPPSVEEQGFRPGAYGVVAAAPQLAGLASGDEQGETA